MNLRVLGKNTLTYALGTISLRAASFIQIPIFTHFLVQSDFGLLSTLLITAQVLINVIDLGIRNGLIRFMSKYEKEKKLDELMGCVIIINLMGGLVAILLTVFLVKPVVSNIFILAKISDYALLTCIVAICQSLCINIMAYYRARNLGMTFLIANIIATGGLILGTIFFIVVMKMGIEGALISQAIVYGTIWIVITATIYKKTGLTISSRTCVMLLKFGVPLMLGASSYLLINTSAVYFLGRYSGFEQVAIYSLAIKLAQIAEMTVTLPFQMAYEPFVFQNIESPDIRNTISHLTTYYLISFALVEAITIIILRDIIHLIAPPGYYSAYVLIFVFVPGSAMLGFFYVGQSLLHIEKKTHITGTIITVCSLLSVPLNYIFISNYGMTGVLIVYNIVMFSMAAITLFMGNKTFPVSFDIKRLAIFSLIFLFIMLIIFISRDLPNIIYYPLIVLLIMVLSIAIYYRNLLEKDEIDLLLMILRNISPKALKIFNSKAL